MYQCTKCTIAPSVPMHQVYQCTKCTIAPSVPLHQVYQCTNYPYGRWSLRNEYTLRYVHFWRIHVGASGRCSLRDEYTSLECCSLRSRARFARTQAFGLRPSACRRWASSLYNVCLHLNPASGVYFPKLTYPCTKREISSKDFNLPLVKIGEYSRVLELELNWLELPSNLN